MPMDIKELKKVGKEIKYGGKKKLDREDLIARLKKQAYSIQELLEIYGISRVRLYNVLRELKNEGYKIERAMYNRRVYVYISE